MAQQIVLKGCWLRNGDVEFHGYQLNIYLSNVTPTLFCSILNSFWLTVQCYNDLFFNFPFEFSRWRILSTPALAPPFYCTLTIMDTLPWNLWIFFLMLFINISSNSCSGAWAITYDHYQNLFTCIKCTRSIVQLESLNSFNSDLLIPHSIVGT